MAMDLAIATPAPGADAAPTACTIAVHGRVVDAVTGESVPGARVRLGELVTATDDDGRWQLGALCPGRESLRVERADYGPSTRPVRVTANASIDVALEPYAVLRIDDVVVEAPAPSRSEMGASTTLDGEALDRTRGRNLADSMARIPGVAVLRTAAGGMGKPIIRGQDERRSLLLFDRVRHSGQKWGVDHAPEIDPFAAGSIKVIKGVSAIRWGPDAIGGVMLVDPPPLRTAPGVAGRAHLVGVSNGKRGAAALGIDGAHRRLPGLTWRVEGNVTRGAAIVTPRYPLDNTGTRQWNVGTTLGYLSERFDVTLGWRRNDMRNGLCTCLRNDSPDEFEQSFALGRPVNADLYSREYRIERPLQRTIHDVGIARSRVRLGKAGDLTATYSLQHNDRREYAIVREGVAGPQYEFDLRTHGGDIVFERTPLPLGPRVAMIGTYGASVQHQDNTYDANLTLIPDYTQTMGGVFGVERLVADRWELEAGARYDGLARTADLGERDFLSQRGTGRLHEARCTPTARGGGRCSYDFHSGSASLGALVRPLAQVREFEVKLELASAGRFPQIDEQFLNGTAPSFPVIGLGDSRLGVERTWGSSLTVSYANEWLATDGSAYANYADDYIYFGPEPSDGPLGLNETIRGTFPVFSFRSVGAVFYGGEVGFRVAPPTWPVEIDGQAALVRARDLRNAAYLAFVPADRYQLGLTYRWPDAWKLRGGFVGVTGTFVDRQRRFDVGADFLAPPPGYFQLGAQAGVSMPLAQQTLRFAVVGTNLTNARFREYTSLLRYFADEPGWELLVRLSLDFEALGPKAANRKSS